MSTYQKATEKEPAARSGKDIRPLNTEDPELTQVVLEPYNESMFEEFAGAIAQESTLHIDLDDPLQTKVMREQLADANRIIMAIRDERPKEFLGYCEIHDINDAPWELGISLLEMHRGRGVGYAALAQFIPRTARQFDQNGLIAKIEPDNQASIRLFQKLGATPGGIERSPFIPNEDTKRRFAKQHLGLIDDAFEETALLFGVDAKQLLGNVLLFDVPANPPKVPPSAQTKGGKRQAPSGQTAASAFAKRELTNDLLAILNECKGEADSDKIAEALSDLRKKWGI